MRGSLLTRVHAALLALACTPCAFATHPLATEDANTVGPGRHQIELNTDWIGDLATPSHVAAMTYTYGWREGLDLFTNLPAGVADPRGISDMSFGAKWVYHAADATRFVLKPELFLPSGSEERGLGTGRPGLGLNFVSTTTLNRWQWHTNLALAFRRYGLEADRAANRNALWRLSSAFQYAVTEKFQLLGDAGISRAQEADDDHRPLYLLAGAIYSPSADVDLDIGIRFNRNCGTCTASGKRQFGAGLTWRF